LLFELDSLSPFDVELIDDEDEVLLALAEELGAFVEHVGGVEFAYTLLAPLEVLATVEESSVRDKAVESMVKIAEQVPAKQFNDKVVHLLKTLASGDWFTSRTSACGLFAVTYSHVTDEAIKTELSG
jgi:serine/threonine-protein phosphatase 2A regulatory subunit A